MTPEERHRDWGIAGFEDRGRGHRSAPAAGKDNGVDSALEPMGKTTALPTPGAQPRETHVGLLTCGTRG